MLSTVFFFLCAAVLVCSLLLGGGTRTGFVTDVVAQLAAIPLLLAAIWRLVDLSSLRPLRWPLAFCGAVVLVPLVQLVPLPPEVWTALPGREPVAAAFGLLQQELPWMPISVSPHATALSALSLLAPVAIFLAMLSLGNRERHLMSLVVLAVGVLSIVVGLNQVAQGPTSPLRIFDVTNPTEAVGFFANRNHFAALLYATTMIAAAWAVESAAVFEDGRRRREGGGTVALAATFTILVVLVAAQIMARSRAGLGLTMFALAGAFALAFFDRRNTSNVTATRLLIAAIGLAVMFAAQFALWRIAERFTPDQTEDARFVFARNTIEAAMAYMPFGSGMGTFVPVYAMFEKPEETLLDTYVNRAHNDFLELWLEAGAAGLLLAGFFLVWFAAASWRWWRAQAGGAVGIDLLLGRAATVIVGLFIAHSFVDYPLRTTAIMSLMAFACALLATPAAVAEKALADEEYPTEGMLQEPVERARTRPKQQPYTPPAPVTAGSGAPASKPGERWGQGIQWPEEWRSPSKQRPAPRPPGPDEPSKKG